MEFFSTHCDIETVSTLHKIFLNNCESSLQIFFQPIININYFRNNFIPVNQAFRKYFNPLLVETSDFSTLETMSTHCKLSFQKLYFCQWPPFMSGQSGFLKILHVRQADGELKFLRLNKKCTSAVISLLWLFNSKVSGKKWLHVTHFK